MDVRSVVLLTPLSGPEFSRGPITDRSPSLITPSRFSRSDTAFGLRSKRVKLRKTTINKDGTVNSHKHTRTYPHTHTRVHTYPYVCVLLDPYGTRRCGHSLTPIDPTRFPLQLETTPTLVPEVVGMSLEIKTHREVSTGLTRFLRPGDINL